MSYGRNFGMRTFENAVRIGRHKVASDFDEATNGTLYIGTAAKVDPTTGNLVRPAAAEAPSQNCGLLVFEHITYGQLGSFNGIDSALTTSSDDPFNKVPKGRYAQLLHGPGLKVWFKNTANKDLYDGRTQTGVVLVAGIDIATPTLAVGDYLTPAADGTWAEGTASNGWLVVEHITNVAGTTDALVEARMTF